MIRYQKTGTLVVKPHRGGRNPEHPNQEKTNHSRKYREAKQKNEKQQIETNKSKKQANQVFKRDPPPIRLRPTKVGPAFVERRRGGGISLESLVYFVFVALHCVFLGFPFVLSVLLVSLCFLGFSSALHCVFFCFSWVLLV